jgi:hypothetical protein
VILILRRLIHQEATEASHLRWEFHQKYLKLIALFGALFLDTKLLRVLIPRSLPPLPLSLCVHTRAAYGLLTWFILSTFQIGSENPQPVSPGSSLKITTELPQPGNALKITTEIPQPGSSLKSKKTSIAKSGKEQLSERKVAESAGGPSDNCNIGSSTKNKSSSPAQSHQHPTPECSGMQTSYILTGLTY